MGQTFRKLVRTLGNRWFGCRAALCLPVLFMVAHSSSPKDALAVEALSQPAVPHERALVLSYDVYVGGFFVFGFDAEASFDGLGYAITIDGSSRGLLGQFWTWRSRLISEGRMSAVPSVSGQLAPIAFTNVSEWRGTSRRITVHFAGYGSYAVERHPSDDNRDEDDGALPDSLPLGTLDPVSAAVSALSDSAQDARCERHLPVFDGKRRYDLTVHEGEGTVKLDPSHFSAYAGVALSCRISIKRISGFTARRSARYWDDDGGSWPTIWAAQLEPDMPLVPVRFLASINIGTMVVHLVHAEVRDGGESRPIAGPRP